MGLWVHSVLCILSFRSWSEVKEADLVKDLSLCLENKVVDVAKLGSMMRGKDHYGNDQLSKQQVNACLRVAGISLDGTIKGRWMKAGDIIEKGIYSIPVLIEILNKAVALNVERNTKSWDSNEAFNNNDELEKLVDHDDEEWKIILSLNSSLPIQRNTITDRNSLQNNIGKLRGAMYGSYNQYHGLLPPKDTVQLSMAYSTVYSMGMDQGSIREAVEGAREQGRGMVNIEQFISAIMQFIM